MRVLYLLIIILFVAAVIVFAVQNRETVMISFLGYSAGASVTLLAVISYVLGAVTGGSLLALLRHSMRRL
jgi:uncharacterized integral membrane protein